MPPIITIAYGLEEDFMDRFNISQELNQKLTIKNIESFFNYRTVAPDFKFVSSILSDKEKFMAVEIASNFTYLIDNKNQFFIIKFLSILNL